MEEKINIIVKEFCNRKHITDVDKISEYQAKMIRLYKDNLYSFSRFNKQIYHYKGTNHKRRLILTYKNKGELFTIEEVLLKLLYREISKKLKIKPRLRGQIVKEFFSSINKIKSQDKFTIISFDLKNYFESVSNEFVYNTYIKDLPLEREEKELLESYISLFPHCMQGLSLSNLFSEILARDIDKLIASAFKKYNLSFYNRYVDDGFIILHAQLDEETCLNIIEKCLDEINKASANFKYKNKVTLSKLKFRCISSSENTARNFSYLGYNFNIDQNNNFTYGITTAKQTKFFEKVKNIIANCDDEGKLRVILKHLTRRVVYSVNNKNKKTWFSRGFAYNYGLIGRDKNKIDDSTALFLKNFFDDIYKELNLPMPSFLSNKITDNGFNLYNNITKNKALVYDEKIGLPKEKLIFDLNILKSKNANEKLSYNQLLKIILEKVGL